MFPALVVFGHIVTLIAVWRLTRLRRQGKRTSGEGKGLFNVNLFQEYTLTLNWRESRSRGCLLFPLVFSHQPSLFLQSLSLSHSCFTLFSPLVLEVNPLNAGYYPSHVSSHGMWYERHEGVWMICLHHASCYSLDLNQCPRFERKSLLISQIYELQIYQDSLNK